MPLAEFWRCQFFSFSSRQNGIYFLTKWNNELFYGNVLTGNLWLDFSCHYVSGLFNSL